MNQLMASPRRVAGDTGGTFLVASNGLRTEVVRGLPSWATLYWWVRDDPQHRADWNRLRGYRHKPENKLSKSEAKQ